MYFVKLADGLSWIDQSWLNPARPLIVTMNVAQLYNLLVLRTIAAPLHPRLAVSRAAMILSILQASSSKHPPRYTSVNRSRIVYKTTTAIIADTAIRHTKITEGQVGAGRCQAADQSKPLHP